MGDDVLAGVAVLLGGWAALCLALAVLAWWADR